MAIHELGYILSMKRYSLISLMLASALCSIVRRAEAATNLLAIHLMAEKADREAVLAGTRRVEDVELVPDPLLSDHDFISYDRTNHIFAVTAEAAKRLSMSMMRRDGPSLTTDGKKVYHFDGPDMPFVLFVSGEPIYVGVFSSPVSSKGYFVRVLWAETPTIPAESTNSVSFLIKPGPSGLGLPPGHASKMDPLNDGRVLEAVKKLRL